MWDLKFSTERKLGIASIYDGYRFSKVPATDDLLPDDFAEFTGHGSICYAMEWHTPTLVLTSSFYDSTLKLIQLL